MEEEISNIPFKYAVKCAIPAHSGDVRVVRATDTPENFVTGSRDTLVKLWIPNTDGLYKEATVFHGATKFVSSLCILPASTQYPKGLILAGSNDCSIYGFAVTNFEPVMKLLGHSDNVCSLSAGTFGTFVSGSWDKTARVWSGQQCHLVLSGHQEAVWAAEFLPEQNLVLTASADCTIRLWCSGKCEKVYSGHTDCVRGLAVLSDRNFLSCSNDCTVRSWDIAGDCLATYEGHSSYIYGITCLGAKDNFATCGEDHKVKIWNNGICVQTLHFAGKTLWSICHSSNGNLAVGCSDGTLLILNKVSLDAEVPEEILDEQQNPDNILLKNEGSYDGETRFLFEEENSCMVVYSWNEASHEWKKKDVVTEGVIGNITGESSNPKSKGKTLNFDIDVEGVMYPITYTAGENPWTVAQNFIVEHNLPLDHASQIADFIIKNTGDKSWNVEPTLPESKFVSYPHGNVDGLKAKLNDFNLKVLKEQQLSEKQISDLLLLSKPLAFVTVEQMTALDIALLWNDDYVYPVLDLVRLAVKSIGMHSKVSNACFINHLLQMLTETKLWINRNLIIKIFCNMFGYVEGNATLHKFQERIILSVRRVLDKGDSRIEKAGTALFLNYAVLCAEEGYDMNVKLYCTNVKEFIQSISDVEAIYRVLIGISNIIAYDDVSIEILNSPEFIETLVKFKSMKVPKTEEVIDMIFMRFENY